MLAFFLVHVCIVAPREFGDRHPMDYHLEKFHIVKIGIPVEMGVAHTDFPWLVFESQIFKYKHVQKILADLEAEHLVSAKSLFVFLSLGRVVNTLVFDQIEPVLLP
jgi:hypothetical protein